MDRIKVRIVKTSESYIHGTMVALTSEEIVLKEPRSFGGKNFLWKREKTEDLIEEILVHETLHLVLLKVCDEFVSTAFDSICEWGKKKPVILILGMTQND